MPSRHMDDYIKGHPRDRFRCPGCGLDNHQTKLDHLRMPSTGNVAIMCWDECGMDFEMNMIWWMMNSWRDD